MFEGNAFLLIVTIFNLYLIGRVTIIAIDRLARSKSVSKTMKIVSTAATVIIYLYLTLAAFAYKENSIYAMIMFLLPGTVYVVYTIKQNYFSK